MKTLNCKNYFGSGYSARILVTTLKGTLVDTISNITIKAEFTPIFIMCNATHSNYFPS